MLKKIKPVAKRKTRIASIPPAAERTYDGELPESAEDWRDGLVLVPIADRPDAAQFPKCHPGGVPPETYYVFDPKVSRCVYMLSRDAQSVSIAWDTDRDGRYFLRARRDLLCPRYVEYSYDHTNAFIAGEHWSHSHPNYRGSLSGKDIGTYEDYQSPKTRALGRKKRLEKPSKATKRIGGDMKPVVTKSAPKKRLGGKKTTDDIMQDRAALDNAAEDAAKELSAAFGSKKRLRKAKQ